MAYDGVTYMRTDGKGQRITVGSHPFRKSLALMVEDGGSIYTCAYFRSAEEADRFRTALRALLGPHLTPMAQGTTQGLDGLSGASQAQETASESEAAR